MLGSIAVSLGTASAHLEIDPDRLEARMRWAGVPGYHWGALAELVDAAFGEYSKLVKTTDHEAFDESDLPDLIGD